MAIKHLAPCGADFDTADDARAHEAHCDQCAGAEEVRSTVGRYILVELTLADGSEPGDADPEEMHAAVRADIAEFLLKDENIEDVAVTLVDNGQVVGEDPIDFDTAEAAGLDGTLRAGSIPEQVDSAASAAGSLLAAVLGDGMTALHVGPAVTCTEAENIVGALIKLGQMDAAVAFLVGHATGDEDGDDDDHLTIDAADDSDAAARDYLSL